MWELREFLFGTLARINSSSTHSILFLSERWYGERDTRDRKRFVIEGKSFFPLRLAGISNDSQLCTSDTKTRPNKYLSSNGVLLGELGGI